MYVRGFRLAGTRSTAQRGRATVAATFIQIAHIINI
jgi:hypothetical protein